MDGCIDAIGCGCGYDVSKAFEISCLSSSPMWLDPLGIELARDRRWKDEYDRWNGDEVPRREEMYIVLRRR